MMLAFKRLDCRRACVYPEHVPTLRVEAFVLKAPADFRLLSQLHHPRLTHVTLENLEVGTLDGGRVGAISCADSSPSSPPSLRAQSAASSELISPLKGAIHGVHRRRHVGSSCCVVT